MYLDTIIHGGIVITMEEPGLGIINRGAVGIKGNQIAAVGPEDEIMRTYKAHRYVNAEKKVVMPGLIDAHTHTADACVRGMAQDREEWMQRAIYKAMTGVSYENRMVASKLALLELMKTGTTTVQDFSVGMPDIIKNFDELGLRGNVAEMVNELPANFHDIPRGEYFEFDHSLGQYGYQNTLKLIEMCRNRDDGMITCMIGPQAADMMSAELLMDFKALSKKSGLDMHIHVSQGEREETQMVLRHGKRTIPFLAEKNFLDPTVHVVHLYSATKQELEYVAKQGCSMTSCVSSVGMIDGMLPPVAEWKNLGGRAWAMGTDQPPGGSHNSMFYEMRATALVNKVCLQKPSMFTNYEMLRAATIGNAKAFGLDDRIGSLKVGKKADVIILDLNYPYFHPIYTEPLRNIVPLIASGANGNEVETVIIDGKFVVDEYKVLTVDEKKLMEEADKIATYANDVYQDRYDGHLLKQYTDCGLY